MPIHLGYCRVSTEKQNLEMQLAALSPLCARVWQEKASAMKHTNRPELTACIEEAKALRASGEDVVIAVYSLSRLGRRVVETVALVEELQKAGIGFKSVSESIDTSTPMGRCFLNILAALGQCEAEVLSERTRAGLQARRSAGIKLGPKTGDYNGQVEKAKVLIQTGTSIRAAAKRVNMSNSTLLRLLNKAS